MASAAASAAATAAPPTKQISFTVPISYQVPAEFQQQDPAALAHAIDLAAHALAQLRSKTTQTLNQTLYEDLRRQATADYEKKLSQSRQELEQAEARSAVLRAQLGETQEFLTRIRQEERERVREILADKERQISELQEAHRHNSARLLESFQTLRQDIVKHQATALATSNNSSIKGRQAEETLAEFLKQVFGTSDNGEEFTIAQTSKDSYSADIVMTWKLAKLMWESKDYKEQVNTKEIQKFRRDFELNKESVLGVMVSFHSGITGHMKAGNIDLETLPDGRMLVYVSNLADSGQQPVTILQSLKPFLEVFVANARRRTLEMVAKSDTRAGVAAAAASSQAELILLRQQRESTEAFIGLINIMMNKHIKTLTESRNKLHVWQKKQTQMFAEMHADIREQELYAKQIMEEIVSSASLALFGEVSAAAVTAAAPTASNPLSSPSEVLVLDTLVFVYSRLAEYDSREQKFIQDCMALAEVEEDAKTSTKELRDGLVRTGNWTEAQINNLRSKVFQPSVWETGARTVRHLKLRG
jgi:hypothetical protein